MRLHVGQPAPTFVARDLAGRAVDLRRYAGSHVLLAFNRAAVCPLCNIRMALLNDRYAGYRAQGLEVLAFFESSPEVAREYLPRLGAMFPLLLDPAGEVYARYGLSTSWIGLARGAMRRSVYREARRRNLGIWRMLQGFFALDGRKARLPADFVLGPEQTIRIAYYGQDTGDFLPFSTLDNYLARLAPIAPARQRPAF